MSHGDRRRERRDYTPVAALDGEVAYLGDPAGDVAWMLMTDWISSPFEGHAPAPATPSRDETIDRYQDRTGHRLTNMWFSDVTSALLLTVLLIRLNTKLGIEDVDRRYLRRARGVRASGRLNPLPCHPMVTLPALEGVEHRFVDLTGGVTIHVADAGPGDGPAVMLVHGFPQNWWQWHALIGPLAADGYRVLCPDLRGAGWSSAPHSRYLKNDMADDLAAVLDRLSVGPVKLVAHDWGGPVAFIMMLRHPAKVTGFFGLNTVAPWMTRDLSMVRHLWRFWYQIPIALPVIGPRVIAADPKARYSGMLMSWVGAGFSLPDADVQMYVECMREPGHAVAGSRWYRTFQTREMLRWLRGEFDDARVDVPVRWLHGTGDPVITPNLLRGYAKRASDFEIELVDGVGHWIVEQRPDLVLDRVRAFLRA